jgi:hypothetical protein
MRKVIAVFGLEVYALLLAALHYLNGVRTDEAKYLLNIPYPHPPLARFVLHTLDAWTYQEFFWRFVCASLVVQSVWIAVRFVAERKLPIQLAVALCWLFNTAVLYQAGTIMMSVLTALEAWIFIALWLRDDRDTSLTGLIGLWWIVSLFTAYQAVLFAPVVWALLSHQRSTRLQKILAFVLPVLLLGLYTLGNPLVIASILIHGQNADSLSVRLLQLDQVWLFGGSVVLSVVGLYGMFRCRLWPLLLSFAFVVAYVFLARFSYYAILFLPLSMAGSLALIRSRQISAHLVAMGVLVVSIFFLETVSPLTVPSPARRVIAEVSAAHVAGPVLIDGAFGHEWEYESHLQILRFSETLFPTAGAVVCLASCPLMDTEPDWEQIDATAPFVYIHSHKKTTPQ